MLNELNLESLVTWINILKTIQYKTTTSAVNINKEKYLKPWHKRTRGSHKFYQTRADHPALSNSFFPKTLLAWNNLPSGLTLATSLEAFKKELVGLNQLQPFSRYCTSNSCWVILGGLKPKVVWFPKYSFHCELATFFILIEGMNLPFQFSPFGPFLCEIL